MVGVVFAESESAADQLVPQRCWPSWLLWLYICTLRILGMVCIFCIAGIVGMVIFTVNLGDMEYDCLVSALMCIVGVVGLGVVGL